MIASPTTYAARFIVRRTKRAAPSPSSMRQHIGEPFGAERRA